MVERRTGRMSAFVIATPLYLHKERGTRGRSHAPRSQAETPTRNKAGVIILPGLGNAATDYKELRDKLQVRGYAHVEVAAVKRWQWGLNARGMFTKAYWQNTLTPSPTLNWYFEHVTNAFQLLREDYEGPISILGHSAGGWLARAYLSSLGSHMPIASLVTLGTPHEPPPEGRPDQTRGLLKYVMDKCSVGESVESFTSVAGCGTVGRTLGAGGSVREIVAHASYAAVCGEGGVDGDGITPVASTKVPEARSVTCLCEHSMLTSPDNWYGSDAPLDDWIDYLL